jgi:hypothetical protein
MNPLISLKAKKNSFLLVQYPMVKHKIKNKMNVGYQCHSVRLFSTKSFKALGTLIYHKAGVQALAFARACPIADPNSHHQLHHPDSAKGSSTGGSVVSVGSRVVPGTDPLAAEDTGYSGTSRGDDDNDGGCEDQDDGNCDDDNDDNNITIGNDDGEEEDRGDDEGDEMSSEEKARRSRWLVSGGKDGRVVVWALMDFRGEGPSGEQ